MCIRDRVNTVLVVNEDLTELGISDESLSKVNIIYVGTHANRTSEFANVLLPSLMVFEKDGSFINQSFRLQRFKNSVPGPRGIITDHMLLKKIFSLLAGEKAVVFSMDALWEQMANKLKQLDATLRWHSLPDEGLELDASDFLDLNFVETKNLKYDPTAFKLQYAASSSV